MERLTVGEVYRNDIVPGSLIQRGQRVLIQIYRVKSVVKRGDTVFADMLAQGIPSVAGVHTVLNIGPV